MDPLAIVPGEDEDTALPDIPHVEIMFDAMGDTVNGVTGAEGFGLTEAQLYAEGVLMANGLLRANAVDGNEGFFSAVGGGLKATYDYIVKMFKSVWEFFFKRDVAKEVDAAVAEVRTLAAEVKALDDKAGNELPKVNKDAQNRFKLAAMAVIEAKTKYVGVVENAEKTHAGEEKTVSHGLAQEIIGEAKAIVPKEHVVIAALKDREEVKSKSDAELLSRLIIENLTAVKTLAGNFSRHSSKVSAEIKAAQDYIKNKDQKADETAKFKGEQLGLLRGILSFTTAIAQSMKKTISVQVDLQHRTNRVFGL